jgi:hypothetical protein
MDDDTRDFGLGVWFAVRFTLITLFCFGVLYAVVHRLDLVPWK